MVSIDPKISQNRTDIATWNPKEAYPPGFFFWSSGSWDLGVSQSRTRTPLMEWLGKDAAKIFRFSWLICIITVVICEQVECGMLLRLGLKIGCPKINAHFLINFPSPLRGRTRFSKDPCSVKSMPIFHPKSHSWKNMEKLSFPSHFENYSK